MDLFLGIDFGTSGARAVVIDAKKTICAEAHYSFNRADLKDCSAWQQALLTLIEAVGLSKQIAAIAINGTSSTVLLCDAQGKPVTEPILYNESRGAALEQFPQIPPNHPASSPSSSLAKLLWWTQQPEYCQASFFLHQADWLAFLLHGQLGISDYHNALKLGYDVQQLCYPDWLRQSPLFPLLPKVLPPGTPVAPVTEQISQQFNLRQACLVCTGTTDSIAAFLASGANIPGEAVTSLGSTLVLKLLSRTYIEDSCYGIYTHRLGNLWLTGGASNTGGAVLRHFFDDDDLAHLSQRINPQQESPLNYYPLVTPGERFPIHDPQRSPQLEPRPDDAVQFLHGLLESMARIEAQGYRLLQELGATSLLQVYTAGGGAKNLAWNQIRQRHLNVPVLVSAHTAAAYGTALLARQSLNQ